MCAKSNCLVNTVKEARCASKFPGKHGLNLALSFIRMKKASSQSLQKCDQLELSLLLLIEAWKKKKKKSQFLRANYKHTLFIFHCHMIKNRIKLTGRNLTGNQRPTYYFKLLWECNKIATRSPHVTVQ